MMLKQNMMKAKAFFHAKAQIIQQQLFSFLQFLRFE
jgi:hypothetical protein